MEFYEAVEKIKGVLADIGTIINEKNYDGLIVKKLESSNTLDEGRTTNQTHIAITGRQMDIFPYLRADGYFSENESDNSLKKYFVGQVPVWIFESNIKYLEPANNTIKFSNGVKKTATSIVRSKRAKQADQLQMSMINLDGRDFVAFRHLLHSGAYMIVLKKNKVFEYEFYGVLKSKEITQYNEILDELNNHFYKLPTNTKVDISSLVSQDDVLNCEVNDLVLTTQMFPNIPRNRIIFGAPGTGKSFKLNGDRIKLLGDGSETNYERVTFHPDYSYGNFVGTYKPVPTDDGISYEYVPGPFIRVLVKALSSAKSDNPKPYLLIIEEINRANVAAVFGDVFQLLDRDEKEISEYPVQVSDDLRKYLSKKLNVDEEQCEKIQIPDNMFIWATMNSADQGVFPMDTAFKRRWEFTYIGINDNDEEIENKTVILGQGEYEREVNWNELRKAINEKLLGYNVNEDKLMGPYFISKKNLGESNEMNPKKFISIFKNKVIMYLFDDAAKQKRQSLFSGCDKKKYLYSAICEEFDEKGVLIFSEDIRNKFSKKPGDER